MEINEVKISEHKINQAKMNEAEVTEIQVTDVKIIEIKPDNQEKTLSNNKSKRELSASPILKSQRKREASKSSTKKQSV